MIGLFEVLLPECSGRLANRFLEQPGEISMIFEAQFICDLFDRTRTMIQQSLGFQEYLLLYPVTNGKTRGLFDRFIEIGSREMKRCGIFTGALPPLVFTRQ